MRSKHSIQRVITLVRDGGPQTWPESDFRFSLSLGISPSSTSRVNVFHLSGSSQITQETHDISHKTQIKRSRNITYNMAGQSLVAKRPNGAANLWEDFEVPWEIGPSIEMSRDRLSYGKLDVIGSCNRLVAITRPSIDNRHHHKISSSRIRSKSLHSVHQLLYLTGHSTPINELLNILSRQIKRFHGNTTLFLFDFSNLSCNRAEIYLNLSKNGKTPPQGLMGQEMNVKRHVFVSSRHLFAALIRTRLDAMFSQRRMHNPLLLAGSRSRPGRAGQGAGD
ncbi:hypothetical protein RRG08_049053 [Elysia crispata]|uniref:Uncharacterized protein n=1 Tax=Elysia crispata TaxID=231223 RepID=A0AAE1AAC4_9GAST|nr:hypothetical protein RRG08_049053 [Elysia crispata]